MLWNDTFLELFDRCLAFYKRGVRNYNSYYSDDDLAFLASIGYKPRELFDFVEDFGSRGVPTISTALLVAAVRRDYFTVVQGGVPSTAKEVTSSDVPARDENFDGIPYLPRLIAKAEAKLRGELDPDLMFCCGSDRNFLYSYGQIPPADFLRHVWAADGDFDKIAKFVRSYNS